MMPYARLWALGRAWEAGPILVKEARQSVRSRALPAVLCLLLVVLVAGWASFLFLAKEDTRAGLDFFGTSLFILLLAEGLAALVLFHRTLEERAPHRRDLLYITTLRPAQIVRGKWVAAMTFSLVLLGAGLPFVTLSYFLRGLSLPTLGGGLLVALLLTALWNLWAIVVGAAPSHVIVKWLLWAGGMAFTGFIILTIGHDVLADFDTEGLMIFLLILAPTCWLLYAIAVFLLQPPNSNRSFPLRLHALAIWLCLAAVGCLAWHGIVKEVILGVVTAGGLLLDAALFVLAFHPGDAVPGERWRPVIRRGRGVLRRLPFLLGETTLGGLAFALLFGLLSSLPALAMDASGRKDALIFIYPYLGYLLVYALTARWLAALLQKIFPQVAGAWVFLILTALGSFASGMSFVSQGVAGRSSVALGCLIAGPLEDPNFHFETHTLTLALWLTLALLVNGPWIKASLRRSPRNGQPAAPPPLPAREELWLP